MFRAQEVLDLTRRTGAILAIALLAGFGAVAAGCGDDDDQAATASGGTPTTSESGAADLSGTKLTYLGFGGGIDDEIKSQLMDPFASETGASFVLDSPTDYKKIEAQIKSNNVSYDIVDGDPYVIDAQCGKQFEPLNIDLSDVQEEFRPFSECGAPDYVYGYVLAHDSEKFPDGGPETCPDFFDTQKFPGKRIVWSYYVSGILECAAIAAGADPMKPYPLDLDGAFEKLEAIKDDLSFYDTPAQAIDSIQNKDAVAGLYPSRALVEASKSDSPFVSSKQWAVRGYGSFGIPKGAPNADAARAWLAHIMKRENYTG